MKRPLSFVVLMALVGISGCYGPKLSVVRQGRAGLLRNSKEVYVAPIELAGMKIEGVGEETWLQGKNAEERAKWPMERAALVETYQAAAEASCRAAGLTVVSAPTESSVILRANVESLDPGYWVWISARDARATLRATLTDGANGSTVDEFTISDKVRSDLGRNTHTLALRTKRIGQELGEKASSYLAARAR